MGVIMKTLLPANVFNHGALRVKFVQTWKGEARVGFNWFHGSIKKAALKTAFFMVYTLSKLKSFPLNTD